MDIFTKYNRLAKICTELGAPCSAEIKEPQSIFKVTINGVEYKTVTATHEQQVGLGNVPPILMFGNTHFYVDGNFVRFWDIDDKGSITVKRDPDFEPHKKHKST